MASTVLRDNLSGTFTVPDLYWLDRAMAWSAAVPVAEQQQEQEAIHTLVREAMEAIRNAETCSDGFPVGVKIEQGKIGEVVFDVDEDEEDEET